MTTLQRAEAIAEALTSAGLRVTLDPRSNNPPCVLITPPERAYDLLTGYTATWQLFLLVPGPWNRDAWRKLDDLAPLIVDTLGPPDGGITPNSYSTDDGGALPAYTFTYTEALS